MSNRHWDALLEQQALRCRPWEAEHVLAMAGIEQAIQPYPWSRKSYEDSFVQPSVSAWVCVDQRQDVQAYVLWQSLADACVELLILGVSLPYQRRAVGSCLLQKLAHWAEQERQKTIFLEVAADNTAAICLYTKNNYKFIRERKNYYRKGDKVSDAWVMSCSLPSY